MMYVTKNIMTIIVYRFPIVSPRSSDIPATMARPMLVRSTRDIEYMMPRIGSSL